MNFNKLSSFNDYTELSTSFNNFDFSSIDIRSSIDFMKFSIHFKDIQSTKIVSFLQESGFSIISYEDYKDDVNTINIKSQINLQGKWYGLFCKIIPKYYRTTFRMVNPDNNYFNHINNILQFSSVLSEAEYSLDFHGIDNGKMFAFLASHTTLKKPGKLFNVGEYDNPPTQYLNSVRDNNQVGGKIYIKENDSLAFVRMEASIKQRQFPIMGIDSIYGATQVTGADVFQKFQIETFDFARFMKNLKIPDYDRSQFEKDFFLAMNGKINCGGLPAVKQFISTLKKHPYNYFKSHPFGINLSKTLENIKFV